MVLEKLESWGRIVGEDVLRCYWCWGKVSFEVIRKQYRFWQGGSLSLSGRVSYRAGWSAYQGYLREVE